MTMVTYVLPSICLLCVDYILVISFFLVIILRKKKLPRNITYFMNGLFLLSDWKLANHRALLLPSNISYKNAKIGYDVAFGAVNALLCPLVS